MKILIFSNIPAPYFVNYLNELGKYAKVNAIFERKKASDRDKSWEDIGAKNFKYEFLNGINFGSEAAFSLGVISRIRRNKESVIIFANPTTPTGIVGIFYCKLHHIKYVLQSEGGVPKNGKGLKERFKQKLLTGASLYLTGMKPEEDYFTSYGAPIEKVKQYPFASLSEKDLISKLLNTTEKQNLKNKLGINYEKVVLFVGRMIPVKGVDILIESCRELPNNVGVYLIGGSRTEEYASLEKGYGVNNTHFIEHLPLEQLKNYYLLADVLVLPTRGDTWGLVINEAMSFGLPVVTTNKCVAGLQLIEEGVNGYIVNVDDPKMLGRKLCGIINDPDICVKMGLNNLDKINDYTYENMARTVFDHISSSF